MMIMMIMMGMMVESFEARLGSKGLAPGRSQFLQAHDEATQRLYAAYKVSDSRTDIWTRLGLLKWSRLSSARPKQMWA